MRIERVMQGEELKEFLTKLENNGGYCPCAVQHIPETKCMCREFLERDEGLCMCEVYRKYKD